MKPGAQAFVWALPGFFLSSFCVLISVAGFASGMPFALAAEILGVAVALGVLWIPVILYIVGTRLTLDGDGLELRELFGLRVKSLLRARIQRIATSVDVVRLDDQGTYVAGPALEVAFYDVVDVDGRRWARLRSWVWNRADCERLRDELSRRTPGET